MAIFDFEFSRPLVMKSNENLPHFISRQVEEGRYYFLNLDPAPSESLVVACGGSERCAANYRVERSAFQYFGIEYVVSGIASFSVDGREYELRPGTVFGYRPQSDCRIESKGEAPLFKRFVDLSGQRAMELFDRSPLALGAAVDLAGVKWVEDLFRMLSRFGEREDELARQSCPLLAATLLLQMGEEAKSRAEQGTPAYQTYLRCRSLIESDYLRLVSAAEVAQRANIDKAYLSRLFQRFDEEAPYRKIVRLKMNHAARLLMGGGAAVKEIAGAVGYEDPLHFSRVFKRCYGISPSFFPSSVNRG